MRDAGSLSSLTHLELAGCQQVGDAGVQALGQLTRLRYLDLSECEALTDNGLLSIHHLKGLTHLDINGASRCFGINKQQL